MKVCDDTPCFCLTQMLNMYIFDCNLLCSDVIRKMWIKRILSNPPASGWNESDEAAPLSVGNLPPTLFSSLCVCVRVCAHSFPLHYSMLGIWLPRISRSRPRFWILEWLPADCADDIEHCLMQSCCSFTALAGCVKLGPDYPYPGLMVLFISFHIHKKPFHKLTSILKIHNSLAGCWFFSLCFHTNTKISDLWINSCFIFDDNFTQICTLIF